MYRRSHASFTHYILLIIINYQDQSEPDAGSSEVYPLLALLTRYGFALECQGRSLFLLCIVAVTNNETGRPGLAVLGVSPGSQGGWDTTQSTDETARLEQPGVSTSAAPALSQEQCQHGHGLVRP